MESDKLQESAIARIDLSSLSKGRHMINWTLFFWVAGTALVRVNDTVNEWIGLLLQLVFILSVIVSCVGVYRVTRVLRLAMIWRLLGLLTMFIPFLNLLVMGILSQRAAKTLMAHGYRLGMFRAISPQ